MQSTILRYLIAVLILPHALPALSAPDPAFLLNISHSVAKVHAYNAKNQLGIGSSVVVAKNQIATNCHVVANASGISINKLGQSFAPIGMKADWAHDLCILVFKHLPLTPLKLGKVDLLQDYERPIIALGFSGSSPRPTRSFGFIKAMIPYDGAHLIQSTSGFRLGASGGALISYDGELLGITTFKSPGAHGHYFSLPVNWIKALLKAKMIPSTTQAQAPFWDTAVQQRPFFMQAITQHQDKAWSQLREIAINWTKAEPNNPEAFFYLAEAFKGEKEFSQAKSYYQKVLAMADNHSSSLVSLAQIAQLESDPRQLEALKTRLEKINPLLLETLEH